MVVITIGNSTISMHRMTLGSRPGPSQMTSNGAITIAGIACPAARYGCTAAASKCDFAKPYPSGNATTRANRKPSILSWAVTSAAFNNIPEAKPLDKLVKTSAGAGRNNRGTCPQVAPRYQPTSKNSANTIGGDSASVRSTALRDADARRPGNDGVFVSAPSSYLRIFRDMRF